MFNVRCRARVNSATICYALCLIFVFVAACDSTHKERADQGVGGNLPSQPVLLKISGEPPKSVAVSTHYYFQPKVNSSSDLAVEFQMLNAPNWASIHKQTGLVTGVPAQQYVGFSHRGIKIVVSDGVHTGVLGPFEIAVTAMAAGSVTLLWQPPTANEDGSPISGNLKHRISYGFEPERYVYDVVLDPGIATALIANLPPNKYWFSISSINDQRLESRYSAPVSAEID